MLKMYMFQKSLKNSDICINAVSLEQCDEGYIRLNADFELRPPIRSREQLKFMYPEW